MLDIKFIKENKDIVKTAAEKKHIKIDIDRLIEIDNKRRKMVTEFEKKKAEQNAASEQIARITDESERKHLIIKMKMLKEVIAGNEAEMKEIIKEWRYLMARVPNIPDMSVPEGEDDADNKEIKKWGEIKEFDFEPKNHIELMQNLDMVDFKRGSKTHGFRGYFLKNDGALLSWAVWNYAQEFFLKKNCFSRQNRRRPKTTIKSPPKSAYFLARRLTLCLFAAIIINKAKIKIQSPNLVYHVFSEINTMLSTRTVGSRLGAIF